ncbi:MAG: LysR family transcriptional regulator [Beijerinckiaceae bacterium]
MRSLNLDQLRTFAKVVELGSFSAAARQLHMTQPAVSLQVRALEERFGVKLIDRFGKRASASPPGLELLEIAQGIFGECDRAAAAMRRYREGWVARVRIGATLTALTYDLPPVLKSLRLRHPEIELAITNMPTIDAVERIVQHQLDFALITLPLKNSLLRITRLRAQNLVAIFPAGERSLPHKITPAFVADRTLVLEHERGAVFALVAQWLAKGGVALHSPMHIATVEGIKKVVASGVGMSIVPDVATERAAAEDLIVRPLKPLAHSALGLIELRKRPRTAALETVRNALMRMSSDDKSGT